MRNGRERKCGKDNPKVPSIRRSTLAAAALPLSLASQKAALRTIKTLLSAGDEESGWTVSQEHGESCESRVAWVSWATTDFCLNQAKSANTGALLAGHG